MSSQAAQTRIDLRQSPVVPQIEKSVPTRPHLELRALDIPRLRELAAEIRTALVPAVCAAGGHLGSNLAWWS
jgi:hypothetical protein